MSTPPTPAGWYPDPDGSGGQRYWDGTAWTEHSSPGVATPELPAEQPTVVVPTRPAPAGERVGAHRKPEPDLEPADSESAEPEPGPTAPVAQWTPPPAFEPQAFRPQAFTAPIDGPSAPGDNRKLIMWFSAACAALLAVLVLVVVYALFLHDPGTAHLGSPTTTPAETTADEPTTEASATQAPAGGESVDGPFGFTLSGVETGSTVSSTEAPVEKTAQGEYVVVRMSVLNRGEAPAHFIGTIQRLHAGGTVYRIDDEASFYLGGGFVEIPPGGEALVGVAFDVPPGTVPESIELHFDPLSPGVQLPL